MDGFHKIDQEIIMQQFIKNLMDFPGCYLCVPTPIRRREAPDACNAWNLVKANICLQTSQMLTMMGVAHEVHVSNSSIMVKDP